MKPKNTLAALTAFWIVFVALEGVASFIGFLYSKKMHAAVRAVSGAVNGLKALFMIILAVSNVLLFIKHVDNGDDDVCDDDDDNNRCSRSRDN